MSLLRCRRAKSDIQARPNDTPETAQEMAAKLTDGVRNLCRNVQAKVHLVQAQPVRVDVLRFERFEIAAQARPRQLISTTLETQGRGPNCSVIECHIRINQANQPGIGCNDANARLVQLWDGYAGMPTPGSATQAGLSRVQAPDLQRPLRAKEGMRGEYRLLVFSDTPDSASGLACQALYYR
jgi:hypothetical protein